jgi:class 3 adenylate cyclase
MKRKIAAILAADIAGYSKLVAEDEEETLRRLESYRAVFQDFMSRFSGRIFNTAGDAVLAEFPSSVDAVRCAIDVQESLRTRNLAYPASRWMSFRIGITIGDVVERDGDLLGDGVNIASRLSGLAQPGGLCISSTVHEQVASKLSVQFVDIGRQAVKNIPSPIHVYALAFGQKDRRTLAGLRLKNSTGRASPFWPIAITAASVAVVAVLAYLRFGDVRVGAPAAPVVASSGPGVTPAAAVVEQPPAPAARAPEPLVPEIVPFIPDRQRLTIRNVYMTAPDYKAIAISNFQSGFITDQKDEETAKSGAIAACQRNTDPIVAGQRCDLYAVGNTVVSARGRPPLPPEPWIVRDPAIETPFSVEAVPLANEGVRGNLQKNYRNGRKPKALAVSAQGLAGAMIGQASQDEAVRRALELCGTRSGVACALIAIDDTFVVPIPTTMKVVGLFHAAGNAAIAPELRDDVARRIANATSGWHAVATGASGRPGVALRAAKEQDAIDAALADCGRQDRACRVIAVGPFSVEPK